MFRVKSRMNFFVKAAILTFICFCIVSVVQLQIEYNNLSEDKLRLEKSIGDYNDSIDKLNDQLARPFDDEYVKNVAREKLNYRMPDEIIFYNDLQK